MQIAMELCDFGSLADVMKIRAKAFTESQVAYIARRTLRALEYLASNNKVHRDIKPANIMLTGDGKIKLGDLGITKDLKADGTLRDRIGSVLYLAPEIARDTPYTAKVDVWSLGITLVELLVGRAPRSSDRTKEILKQLVTEPVGPALHLPRASAELLNFLHRVLQVDPSKRPTAAELLADPFILKASSTSVHSLIEELRATVSLSGGFQAALSVSSNSRIQPASFSTEFTMDSQTDEMQTDEPNAGQLSVAPFDLLPPATPALFCHPAPLDLMEQQRFVLESAAEIDTLLARPIVDSPVWNRPAGPHEQYLTPGFVLNAN